MKTRILDGRTLNAVSPVALSAYARGEGWAKTEVHGEFADIYIGKDLPEIILPRTDRIADYASVISRLIGIFSEVVGHDEIAIYRDLVSADHDVVRVRTVVSKKTAPFY